MKKNCKYCNKLFDATRYSKTCDKCTKKSHQNGQAKRNWNICKLKWVSVNDRHGKFAGFVYGATEDDVKLVQLPRGYKKYGKIV